MNYYVMCPYGYVTGGPDALHQMVYYLNSIGKTAHIVYFDTTKHNRDIPIPYKRYVDGYLTLDDINDSEDNTIIIPEYISYMSNRFKKSSVKIWWLSVDYNFTSVDIGYKMFLLVTYPMRLLKFYKEGIREYNRRFVPALNKSIYSFKNERNNVSHLCASYYAYEYVSKKTKRSCNLCIEPISKIFLETYNPRKEKKNQVIFNPKKCGEFVSKIIEKSSDINFIPLVGYTQNQLIELYQESKLYIDFGPFPGAERMPKEAVINGCAIITGRNGASNYYNDVLIPDKYKIESKDENINKIIDLIKYVLNNYDDIYDDYASYRERVHKLESEFIDTLGRVL